MRDLTTEDEDIWFGYEELIDSMEYETLVVVSDHDYQGDSRFLLRDGDRYGVLIFGWGSCSGCDSLQACASLDEVVALRDELHQSIIWGSAYETFEYARDHDWEGTFLSSTENLEFQQACLSTLDPILVESARARAES